MSLLSKPLSKTVRRHEAHTLTLQRAPTRQKPSVALYTIHLAKGHRTQCCTIKSCTIKRHLLEAAAISDSHKLLDPRIDSRGNTSPCITKVTHEMKRWESMPNHCEPVMVAMEQHMHALCANQNEDSLDSSLFGWNVLGLYCGFRLRK